MGGMDRGSLRGINTMKKKIPTFKTEQEEAEFWDIHDSTEYLDDTEPINTFFIDSRPPKKQISLRLDEMAIKKLKVVAQDKGIGYQTMIRMWVMERLQEEG
jgi:predicted DNA binding CopG/RHH family protein